MTYEKLIPDVLPPPRVTGQDSIRRNKAPKLKARQAGVEAEAAGEPIEANPYDYDMTFGSLWRYWRAGWRDSRYTELERRAELTRRAERAASRKAVLDAVASLESGKRRARREVIRLNQKARERGYR
jgi:hypothetical protein